MVFSILFPTTLGFIVASVIFTGGSAIGLSGIQMMWVFYAFVVLLTIVLGLHKTWSDGKRVRLPEARELGPQPS
jgi:ferrous iron transport protein B